MRSWILIAVAVAVTGTGCQRAGSPDSAVAARVNGANILRSDVDNYLRVRTQDMQKPPEGEMADLLRLQILRELIEAQIMEQKAEELKIVVADAEIDADMASLRGEVAEAEFQQTLSEKGVTEADLRNEVRRTLLMQKVIENQIRSKVSVSDEEVQKFYEENKEAFNVQEPMYRIGVIAVSSDPSAPVNNLQNHKALNEQQAIEKIQMLEIRARAGEDFQQLARQYSEDPQTAQAGGDMGYQTAAMLERFGPAFRDTVVKMQPGDLTPVVRVPGGYFIFRLLGKRDPGQHDLSDAEVNQSIRDELQGRKHQLLSEAFNEQLHSQARVENYLAREILASFQ